MSCYFVLTVNCHDKQTPTHRPWHGVVASLDDDLWPPADPSHPPEQAVRVDQLVAVRQLVSLTHSRPDPCIRVVLDVGEGHLEERSTTRQWWQEKRFRWDFEQQRTWIGKAAPTTLRVNIAAVAAANTVHWTVPQNLFRKPDTQAHLERDRTGSLYKVQNQDPVQNNTHTHTRTPPTWTWTWPSPRWERGHRSRRRGWWPSSETGWTGGTWMLQGQKDKMNCSYCFFASVHLSVRTLSQDDDDDDGDGVVLSHHTIMVVDLCSWPPKSNLSTLSPRSCINSPESSPVLEETTFLLVSSCRSKHTTDPKIIRDQTSSSSR